MLVHGVPHLQIIPGGIGQRDGAVGGIVHHVGAVVGRRLPAAADETGAVDTAGVDAGAVGVDVSGISPGRDAGIEYGKEVGAAPLVGNLLVGTDLDPVGGEHGVPVRGQDDAVRDVLGGTGPHVVDVAVADGIRLAPRNQLEHVGGSETRLTGFGRLDEVVVNDRVVRRGIASLKGHARLGDVPPEDVDAVFGGDHVVEVAVRREFHVAEHQGVVVSGDGDLALDVPAVGNDPDLPLHPQGRDLLDEIHVEEQTMAGVGADDVDATEIGGRHRQSHPCRLLARPVADDHLSQARRSLPCFVGPILRRHCRAGNAGRERPAGIRIGCRHDGRP